jgi:hypothetical protein
MYVRTNFGFYILFKTKRANLECQPIFQEEVEIFVLRPCRRVQTGTGKGRCEVQVLLQVADNDLLARYPDLVGAFWLDERLPRPRVPIQALLHQHI